MTRSSPYRFFLYDKRDLIAHITINRPEVLNALHPPASAELLAIWRDFKEDGNLWVAIFTGAGDRAFSAGMDLKWAAAHEEQRRRDSTPRLDVQFGGMTDAPASFGCWKPIIAAVNGYALGGGLEMALACDIVVAADHAQFGLPEVKRGLIPGAGGVHRLPRTLPRQVAMRMLLTGQLIDAPEAYRLGLVSEVVPRADLLPAAERWAHQILEASPLAVQAAKQAALLGLDWPLEVAIHHLYPAVRRLRESEDVLEGPRAFAEKRRPQWQTP
jgi:enoyl-CoA hydratase/carnithine racemase